MAETVVFEVKEYMVVMRQLENIKWHTGANVRLKGIVRCIGDEHVMDIYGLAADSDVPLAEYLPTEEEKKGYMFVPFEDLPVFIDLLRNEKPIYAHLRGDNPEWTSLMTTKEPVGEGEDAMKGNISK